MSRYYYCYNPVKKNYLLEKGVGYIDKDIHKKTLNTFWIFVRDEKLDKALEDWRKVQNERFKQ